MTIRHGAMAMGCFATMTLLAATNVLGTIATLIATAIGNATLAAFGSTTKAILALILTDHAALTTTSIARHLAVPISTKRKTGQFLAPPTTVPAPGMLCQRVRLATGSMTVTAEPDLTTTMTAIPTNARATAAGLREDDLREADEIGASLAEIAN
jgi:hypothetical protein